jgi:hypothetical protein
MSRFLPVEFIVTAAIALSASAPVATAEDLTMTLTCQNVGASPLEPLGDRDGHAISVAETSCRIDSGPMSGGVVTAQDIWEWDKTDAVLLSASGVIRKPGATVVFRDNEGKLSPTISDGKVTGWTAAARGSFPLATGDAAALSGRSYTLTARPTGPAGQFTAEMKSK